MWFRYTDDLPCVLPGVDLLDPYGSTVALVGRNGSGMSTMVKLLCRFHDEAILWNGADLRELTRWPRGGASARCFRTM